MKTLVAIILALGLGFAAAYFVVSKKDVQAEAVNIPTAVVPVPTSELVEKIVTVTVPSAPVEESPQAILDDLLNVKLGEGSARNMALRMVVFKLETLSQRGKSAVPAIRAFFARNVDVDYNQQDSSNVSTNQADANGGGYRGFRGGGGSRGSSRRARNLQTLQADWVVPPSLRLGLVGTLKEIGGAESEQALAEMLSTTARGIEVAYLAVMLDELAPGKYRAAAAAAARELLMNPPAVDSPNQLDQLAKSYLYGVLEYFKDPSFAVNARLLLVGKDGTIDRDAMDYLSTVLKEQAVPTLYAAYQNPALTNQYEQMRVGREVLNYVGQSAEANQLFTDTMGNPTVDARMKTMLILQQAGGGFGPTAGELPTDPQVVSSRLALLNSMAAQFANDPAVSKALALATTALKNGKPVDPQDLRGMMRGGGGGGGGFGGPPGGGN